MPSNHDMTAGPRTPDSFTPGEAISWTETTPQGYTQTYDAVVLEQGPGAIRIVLVLPSTENTKFYDEGGSNYETDRDNVRLRHCPKPFQELSDQSAKGCYAVADMSWPIVLSADELARMDIRTLDGGILVKKQDMDEIRNHPWVEEKQKELTPQEGQEEETQEEPAPSLLGSVATAEPEPEPGQKKTISRDRATALARQAFGDLADASDGIDFELG